MKTTIRTNNLNHCQPLHCLLQMLKESIHTHAHTHAHTQPFYGSLDFVRDNPSEPVPEETFTHSHISWSSIVCYLLPPSITIHGILPVQFTCLTFFFHNLSPSFLWSTSWPGTLHFILHTFLHPSSFFATHAHTIATCFAVVPRLCHQIQVQIYHVRLAECWRGCWHSLTQTCIHVSQLPLESHTNFFIKSCKPSAELRLPSTAMRTPRHLPCMPCRLSSPCESCILMSVARCNNAQIMTCSDHFQHWTVNHPNVDFPPQQKNWQQFRYTVIQKNN